MEASKERDKVNHYNSLLQLSRLSSDVKEVAASFGELPETDHADGKYRLRAYSQLRASGQGHISRLPSRSFTQSSKYNQFQGDVARRFEDIQHSVVNSEFMKEMCHLFLACGDLTADTKIEIHQLRVITLFDSTEVAPEGVHQDGYDCIAMIGVNRQNVTGGEILVYDDRKGSPFVRRSLETGDMIILDDKTLWHNAHPIRATNTDELGYLDLFVLTANIPS
jgi:hypothetical protein